MSAIYTPGAWDPFYGWLKSNGCFVRVDKGMPTPSNFSHLLLSGGRLLVPDDLHQAFYLEILKAAKVRQEPIYLVEMPTLEGFRLFCELDLVLDDKELSTSEIRTNILPPIQSAVRTLFPGKDTKVIVCTTAPKRVNSKENNQPAVKNGIHLVWPEIIVNRTYAMKVRGAMLFNLSHLVLPAEWSATGRTTPHEGWEASLDKAVFDKNGLRPIWSRKASLCPSCHNQRGTERKNVGISGVELLICSTCQNVGRIDEGRPYEIVDVVSDRGVEADARDLDILKSDWMLQLQATSIRKVPRATPDQLCVPQVPENMKMYCDGLDLQTSRRKRKTDDPTLDGLGTRYRAYVATPGQADADFRLSNSKASEDYLYPVEFNDPEYIAIFNYARDVLAVQPASLKRNKFKSVYILTTRSHICLNKGGPHGSSTVYYVFNIEGVRQLCWSKKPTVYQPSGKTCSEYRSPPMPYDPEMKKHMQTTLFSENLRRIHPEETDVDNKRVVKVEPLQKMTKDIKTFLCSKPVKDTPDATLLDKKGLLPLTATFELITKREEERLQERRKKIVTKKEKLDGQKAAKKLKLLTSPK